MNSKLFPSPHIPKPDSQCLCGKKKTFSTCCGSTKRNRKPPPNVIIKRSAIEPKLCDNLVAFASVRQTQQLSVEHKPNSENNILALERESTAIDLGDKAASVYSMIDRIFRSVAEPMLNIKVSHFTYPSLMRYEPGGYYHPHADSEVFNPDLKQWEKKVDRDISLLLYLNSEFEGGDLRFSYFNYTFSPRKGDLLLFPSDHRYMHEAQIVTKGTRYVIVSWASLA